MWSDVAAIVFACVTMNHLGLIGTIEGIVGKSIPIINCPKCASLWFTLAYMIVEMGFSVIPQIPFVVAVAFIASYAAIWLELFEGFIDTLYLKLYGKIYGSEDNEAAADAIDGDSDSSMSEL